jgi:uncharacterized membrane protein HdeD (DUF308 family)
VLSVAISLTSIVLCFIPVLLFLMKKMSPVRTYLCISLFWLINGILNIPDCFGIEENRALSNNITLIYNLLETPLALLIFYFASDGNKKKFLSYLLPAFILFEIVALFWKGYNWDSSLYIIGAGICLGLMYSVWGISEYFSKVRHDVFESTMGYVYAGFIFYYGLYLVIFYFSYVNYEKATVPYNLFVYNLSIVCAAGLISYGFWLNSKRRHSSSSS